MSLNTEIDSFTFESKIRSQIKELIGPTIRRTLEMSEIVETVLKHDTANEQRLSSLEYNVSKILSRLPLLDELYKNVHELQSEKQTIENIFDLKFESVVSQIKNNTHETENLILL